MILQEFLNPNQERNFFDPRRHIKITESKAYITELEKMPLGDSSTFSDPFPWVWVPSWFVTIAAISGNSTVIFLIATTRRLRTQINVFIVSLAIADLCFGLTYFPTFFTCEFYLPCDRQLRQIFAAYFAFASLTNVCVMTVERYVAIVMPFKYLSFMTSRCVVGMVILSWLFPTVFYFLTAVILTQVDNEAITNAFRITRVFLFQITPCLSLLLATIQMFYIAQKHSKKMAALTAQLKFNYPMSLKPKEGADISSSRFIGIVVFVTVLCYASDSYFDLRTYYSSFQKTIDTEYAVCLLFLTNSAVNPLAYALFKHDIKNEFKRLFILKRKKVKGIKGANISSVKS